MVSEAPLSHTSYCTMFTSVVVPKLIWRYNGGQWYITVQWIWITILLHV
jgi:hypothetical protein